MNEYDEGRHDERKRIMQLIGAVRMDYQTGGSDGSVDVLDRLVTVIVSEPLADSRALPAVQPVPLPNETMRAALELIANGPDGRASCHYRGSHDDDCPIAIATSALNLSNRLSS